ncbi:tetratricopeptide repeat protein [Paraglaciecola marina]|uniref:tetratricopeptide repeat protein n=1 Tax=Paraglaciecola marina TaxID=2500157 RepID=UPI0010611A70|nr:tetratricopeptide repeat protein [Paraglaciecola marina]
MKKYLKHLCAVSALTVAVVSPSVVYAQAKAKPVGPIACPDYKRGPTNIPSQKVGKKVGQALEFYNNDQVTEALDVLYEIETSDGFDRAFTDRFIGNLLATQNGQGKKSIEFLSKAVASNELNDSDQVGTIKLIADLSLQEEEYDDAIKWYNQWMDVTCKEDFDAYFRISNAYYQTGKFAEIIEPINKAISLADKPNKTAYALKMTSYYNRKMYKETIAVQEDIVRLFAEDKAQWTQLGFFYLLVEDNKKALSTFEVAYGQGYLTKAAEIKALSQLYTMNDIPIKAAKILEEHIESGLIEKDAKMLTSIATSYQQAKEFKEAASYYEQSALLSSDPDMYQKQGVMLYIAERYNESLVALQKALDGGSDKVGRIHLTMMEANFYKGSFKTAYKHVLEAKKDKSTARSARSWEPYIKEKAKNRGITL